MLTFSGCISDAPLAGDFQRLGDRLPTPALLARIGDVDRLESLAQSAQCLYRAQADRGVGAAHRVIQAHSGQFGHGVNLC